MGNNCCAARESDAGANFDKKEQKALKEMFSNLANSDTEFYIIHLSSFIIIFLRTKGKLYISEKAILGLFSENKDFGGQLYQFMLQISGTSIITCEVFLQAGKINYE